MAATKYIRQFFAEKEIPFKQWELTDKQGGNHIISNEVVIENIKNAPKHEQDAIANILRKIDFKNGDVNHFLKHLAQALVEQNPSPF